MEETFSYWYAHDTDDDPEHHDGQADQIGKKLSPEISSISDREEFTKGAMESGHRAEVAPSSGERRNLPSEGRINAHDGQVLCP